PAPYAGSSLRVLIVDDQRRARDVLAATCTSLGLAADGAIDGWDALRQASLARQAGRGYALALLDAQMTGMTATECARQLSRSEVGVPAIVLAGAFGRDEVMQHLAAQRVTVRAVLTKPLTAAALRGALATVLPLGGAQGAPVAAPASDAELLRLHRAQLRGARLLLVDDNAIMQEIARELLGSAGIRVQVAANGVEALQRLSSQTFDGVLMDCQMPVMDGFEATRALRERPSLKDLPVIALTADSLDGDRERVIKAGMNDHIGKPFEVEEMFATLARWVHPAPLPAAPPPPAASAPSEDPLARLPGIDVQIGRNSTMSNDALYRRLLGMYREGQRHFGAQFGTARASGDHATALRLVHNLRATSGSLGAVAVQQSARALETACARGDG
ncbi:MAG: response regulator, partial [Rhizobacter sp.]